MFSTKEQLIKKTGQHGVGRFSFLQQLVNEYNATKSQEAKEQVLANLANFAYDPVNYDYLWRLKILDLFFGALEDNNNRIVSYAIKGICNICLEPLSREYILRTEGVKSISHLLSRNDESILLSTITTLIYLDTPSSRKDITATENQKRILEISQSNNPRLKNIAIIFLKDLCNRDISAVQYPRKFAIPHKKSNNNRNFNSFKFATAQKETSDSVNSNPDKTRNIIDSTSGTASTSSTPY